MLSEKGGGSYTPSFLPSLLSVCVGLRGPVTGSWWVGGFGGPPGACGYSGDSVIGSWWVVGFGGPLGTCGCLRGPVTRSGCVWVLWGPCNWVLVGSGAWGPPGCVWVLEGPCNRVWVCGAAPKSSVTMGLVLGTPSCAHCGGQMLGGKAGMWGLLTHWALSELWVPAPHLPGSDRH